jgi:hypothetical protein
MIRSRLFIPLLLCLISTVTIADPRQDPDKEHGKGPDQSVEETERQKIIAELSYRLETKLTCKQKLTWSDKGSGADLDGFFFTPSAESSYYIIGGYASRKGDPNAKKCVISVRPSKSNPEETPELLVPPSDWSLIWTDKGSGADTDGSMWHGVPPGKGYKCLGSVAQKGYKKPVLSNYRCVHSGLTKKIQNKSIVWTDKGSGADRDVTVFNLPNSKSFFAVGRKINQVKTYDLNDTASIEPDAAVVEKLLAQRMEEIHKNEEAEKKRLAEEAEKKRKAEESEQQQEKIVVEAEQEKLEQGTEDIQEAEESEQQSITEVVMVQQPDVNKEINQQQAIGKAGEKDSNIGLKILLVSMLLLLIYVAYRVFMVLIEIIKGDK